MKRTLNRGDASKKKTKISKLNDSSTSNPKSEIVDWTAGHPQITVQFEVSAFGFEFLELFAFEIPSLG
jgi:hypothetical protein